MSGLPPTPFLTCTTRPSRASCSPLPAKFSFLVLIGSHTLNLNTQLPPTFYSFCLFLKSCNQHLLVAFPTLLRACFFRKFHPPLVIVHPCPGSRHVIRPSVVMILVSSTRSSHTCDESWILTKPPAGISWSRNQFFPITSGVSCSRRSPGSCADVGIEGASHCMLLRMNSEPFLSIGLLTTSG